MLQIMSSVETIRLEINNCMNLTYLYTDNDQIKIIPSEIGKYIKLTNLDFSMNNITVHIATEILDKNIHNLIH